MRNSFKVTKGQFDYFVHYVVRGVHTCCHVKTKKEVEVQRKLYKSLCRKKSKIPVITGYGNGKGLKPIEDYVPPKEKKEKESYDEWFNKRNKEDSYVLEHHSLKYLTKNRKRKKFLTAQGTLVWEQQVVKFFIVPSNYNIDWLQGHKLVQEVYIKKPTKMKGGKKLLVVIPHFVPRNNRIAFDFPFIPYPEMPSQEADKYWNIGIEKVEIKVSDIPKVEQTYDTTSVPLVKNIERNRKKALKREKEIKQQIERANRIILLPKFEYFSPSTRISAKCVRSHDREERRILGKIDSMVKKMKNKKLIEVFSNVNKGNNYADER